MAVRVEALINPELLVWARESIGYSESEAAKKAQVKEEKLLAWESGDEKPTFKQLMTLADIYKRPLAAFYLSKPPVEIDVVQDFRKLMDTDYKEPTPKVKLELRKAIQRREDVLGLLDLLEEQPSFEWRDISYSQDTKTIADSIRTKLRISYDTQLKWLDEYKALSGWISAIEQIGILVFQSTRIPLSEMRGFSVVFHELPIITLNGSDAPYARIFTLIHELAHIVSRKDADDALWIDYGDDSLPTNDQARRMEQFCNQVAGEVLVPEVLLRQVVEGRKYDWGSISDVQSLARMFSVSLEVVYRRILAIGFIQENLYSRIRRELSENAKLKKKTKGFVSPDRLAVRNNGLTYTSLVLSAYSQDEISLKNVSDYLGVKVRHIPNIKKLVTSNLTIALEGE